MPQMGNRNSKRRRKKAKSKPVAKQRTAAQQNKHLVKRLPEQNGRRTERKADLKDEVNSKQELLVTHNRTRRPMVTAAALLAILSSILLAVGALLYSDAHHRDIGLWVFVAGIVTAVIGGGCVYQDRLWTKAVANNATSESERQIAKLIDQVPQNTGLLVPGNGPMPAIELAEPVQDRFLYLYLGSCVAWNSQFPHTVLSQHGIPPETAEDILVINKSDLGVGVRAKFFDASGKWICEIVDNRFTKNEGSYRLVRPNPRELIITDDSLKHVLHVEYINPQAVRIFGDFFARRGIRIQITPEFLRIGGSTFQHTQFGENRIDREF